MISQRVPRHQGDSTGIDGEAFEGTEFEGTDFGGTDIEGTPTGPDQDTGPELHSPVPDSFDAVPPRAVPQSAPQSGPPPALAQQPPEGERPPPPDGRPGEEVVGAEPAGGADQ